MAAGDAGNRQADAEGQCIDVFDPHAHEPRSLDIHADRDDGASQARMREVEMQCVGGGETEECRCDPVRRKRDGPDDEWRQAYKRQMEFYQWLLRRNGFRVNDRGYFVYVNGHKDREAFDGRLEFDVKLIPYDGSDEWVEESVCYARDCLKDDDVPDAAEECEWCAYARSASSAAA